MICLIGEKMNMFSFRLSIEYIISFHAANRSSKMRLILLLHKYCTFRRWTRKKTARNGNGRRQWSFWEKRWMRTGTEKRKTRLKDRGTAWLTKAGYRWNKRMLNHSTNRFNRSIILYSYTGSKVFFTFFSIFDHFFQVNSSEYSTLL